MISKAKCCRILKRRIIGLCLAINWILPVQADEPIELDTSALAGNASEIWRDVTFRGTVLEGNSILSILELVSKPQN